MSYFPKLKQVLWQLPLLPVLLIRFSVSPISRPVFRRANQTVSLFLIVVLALQLLGGLLLVPRAVQADGASWYNANWLYRKPITIDNTSNGNTLTDYQVQVSVTYDSGMQDDFDDIRFTNSDGTTLIDYWLETKTDSTSATFLVEVPSISASSNKTVYMYYGYAGVLAASNGLSTFDAFDDFEFTAPRFGGVWYPSPTAGVYGGPSATYSNWNRPIAVHVPSQNKTFFGFGNTANEPTISYYDHATRSFAEPVVLGTNVDADAHRNPSVLVDEDGYIYAFWGSHTSATHVSKSNSPYDITAWTAQADLLTETSYPQPWQLEEDTIFVSFREDLGHWKYATSTDRAATWSESTTVIDFAGASGIYLVSIAETGSYPRKIHLAWSYYMNGAWDERWDVYYAYSDDGGTTWKKRDGTVYDLPITAATAEKVYESGDEGVWLNDIQLDSSGNPHILFISANRATKVGTWKTAHYVDGSWAVSNLTDSDHMYDLGNMVILGDNDIRAYLPSTPTQAGEDGGDIEEWISTDGGATWANTKHVTLNSPLSHNSVKTVWNHQSGDFRTLWSYGDSLDDASSRAVKLYYYGEERDASVIWDYDRSVVWTQTTAGGTIAFSTEQAETGSKSVKIVDNSAAATVSKTTTSISKASGIVGVWMRAASAFGYLSLYAYEGPRLRAVVGLGNTGHFRYWNGANHDTAEGYSADAWYLVTIEFVAADGKYNFAAYDAAMNQVSRVNDISFGDLTGSLATLDTFVILTSSAGTVTGYIDGFRTRGYTFPEPSSSVGSEEGYPTSSPSNLTAALSSNNISLSVNSFTNDTAGSSGYLFSRDGASSGWVQTNSWTDTEASCGMSYDYSVKYRNVLGVETDPISLTASTSECPRLGTGTRNRNTWSSLGLNTQSGLPSFSSNASQVSASAFFAKTLSIGMSSNDVRRLQELLAIKPEIYPEGLVTGYFGPLTRKATQRFQAKYGIVSSGTEATTGYGLVGPKTRAKILEVFGQ